MAGRKDDDEDVKKTRAKAKKEDRDDVIEDGTEGFGPESFDTPTVPTPAPNPPSPPGGDFVGTPPEEKLKAEQEYRDDAARKEREELEEKHRAEAEANRRGKV